MRYSRQNVFFPLYLNIHTLYGIVLVATALLFSSCDMLLSRSSASTEYYLAGEGSDRVILGDLFELLANEQDNGEEQFSVVREIANELLRLQEYGKLANFLTEWVARHPDNPYNSYLLLMCAYTYLKQDAPEVAVVYFERIVKNYPDLTVRGESIHLAALKKLIELVQKPEQQAWYYQELISRFPEKIDLGEAYFMLAQAYEKIGEWDSAIKTYTRFLPYYSSNIPGFPDAFNYAKNIVDFNNSPKDWTFDSLDSLVSAIKSALYTGNAARLRQYKAKINFFAKSWEQENSDTDYTADFYLADFLSGNRVRYAQELDPGSNANEAYLRTWGWSQMLSVWYLYFRKINFPADPEIHGRWEWTGVYYGERF